MSSRRGNGAPPRPSRRGSATRRAGRGRPRDGTGPSGRAARGRRAPRRCRRRATRASPRRPSLARDGEAVVLARHEHAPVARSSTGWFAPRWPNGSLKVREAGREREQLVAEADAEHRHAAEQLARRSRPRRRAAPDRRGRSRGATPSNAGERVGVDVVREDRDARRPPRRAGAGSSASRRSRRRRRAPRRRRRTTYGSFGRDARRRAPAPPSPAGRATPRSASSTARARRRRRRRASRRARRRCRTSERVSMPVSAGTPCSRQPVGPLRPARLAHQHRRRVRPAPTRSARSATP